MKALVYIYVVCVYSARIYTRETRIDTRKKTEKSHKFLNPATGYGFYRYYYILPISSPGGLKYYNILSVCVCEANNAFAI